MKRRKENLVEIIEVKKIRGHKEREVSVNPWIEFKSLDDMKKFADAYKIPYIFKKDKEYFMSKDRVNYCYTE